jgi:hypothetical protein
MTWHAPTARFLCATRPEGFGRAGYPPGDERLAVSGHIDDGDGGNPCLRRWAFWRTTRPRCRVAEFVNRTARCRRMPDGAAATIPADHSAGLRHHNPAGRIAVPPCPVPEQERPKMQTYRHGPNPSLQRATQGWHQSLGLGFPMKPTLTDVLGGPAHLRLSPRPCRASTCARRPATFRWVSPARRTRLGL